MSDFIDILAALTLTVMSPLLSWKILKAALRLIDGDNRRKGPPTHPLPVTSSIETSRRSKSETEYFSSRRYVTGGITMKIFSAGIPWLRKNLMRIACCTLLFWCASLMGQENSSNSPGSDAAEQEALKILNDSGWAHTVKPSLQDSQCSYQNPAFPDLYPKDKAVRLDTMSPAAPPDAVKSDDSEYLVRFQSAKPVQTAIQELLATGQKWVPYGMHKHQVSEDGGPTDLANARYNVADMITIAVILKRVGSDGTSMFNYGFEDNGRTFPSHTFLWGPCSGLRTSNGEVSAHLVPQPWGYYSKSKALQLSFPRLIDGKLLIANPHEKVEFRMVVNLRVFETTFYVNASDVLDGSEKLLYLPSAFTDLKEMAQR